MTTITMLWLPVLLSAVLVFVASSVIHMALPIHKGDFRKLPDEDSIADALRRSGAAPGQYMFPFPASMRDIASPEMLARFRQGPVGTMVLRPPGSPGMGAALVLWFAFCLVVAVLVAGLAGFALAPGAAAGHVFRVTAIAALLGFAFSSVSDSIWKGLAWNTTLKFVGDGIVYALVVGGTFAWLWPGAS